MGAYLKQYIKLSNVESNLMLKTVEDKLIT